MKKAIAGIVIGIIGIGTLGCANEVVEQPAIQSGNQAVITCESGIIHMDGIAHGETVKVKWSSPVIGGTDMVKTLYCLNGSVRAE